jgi:hypothetical protein
VNQSVPNSLSNRRPNPPNPTQPAPKAVRVESLRGIFSPFPNVRISGPAVELAALLSDVARGGQVLLSLGAWESVKHTVTQHPGAVQVRGRRRRRRVCVGAVVAVLVD